MSDRQYANAERNVEDVVNIKACARCGGEGYIERDRQITDHGTFAVREKCPDCAEERRADLEAEYRENGGVL